MEKRGEFACIALAVMSAVLFIGCVIGFVQTGKLVWIINGATFVVLIVANVLNVKTVRLNRKTRELLQKR
jgi:Ca2+-dependent lipid-binding protein